ncbi:hypothetical protein BB560_004121 [Smittium megazygosporum]|uniref:Uncharacterized protein n=1 Tax=Smittium megazygosporum TaxID=133381 RepID=A0A2T9ZA20_9FUNG|nr:hypothetical protein BB560_004121 [Smittium megazygosporum]
MDWLSKRFSPENFFVKSFDITNDLRKVTNSINNQQTTDELLNSVNKGNGVILENSILLGPVILFWSSPIVWFSVKPDEIVRSLSSCEYNNHIYTNSNSLWFGWENSYTVISENIVNDTTSQKELESKNGDEQDKSNPERKTETPSIENTITSPAISKDARKSCFRLVCRFYPNIWCSKQTILAIDSELVSKNKSLSMVDSREMDGEYHEQPQQNLLEDLIIKDSKICRDLEDLEKPTSKYLPNVNSALAFERPEPSIEGFSLCKIAINEAHDVFRLLPIVRRQVVFNNIYSSCYSKFGFSESSNGEIKQYRIKVLTSNDHPYTLLVYIGTVEGFPSISVGHPDFNTKKDWKPDVSFGSNSRVSNLVVISINVLLDGQIFCHLLDSSVVGSLDTAFKSKKEIGDMFNTVKKYIDSLKDKQKSDIDSALSDICSQSFDISSVISRWIRLTKDSKMMDIEQ